MEYLYQPNVVKSARSVSLQNIGLIDPLQALLHKSMSTLTITSLKVKLKTGAINSKIYMSRATKVFISFDLSSYSIP